MAEIKTKRTTSSVPAFIASIVDEEKRKDAKTLVALFRKATGQKPVLWGTSIIGFGQYHYKSTRSAQEGDWPITGFSPRKQALTIYIMCGAKTYSTLLAKLGPHKLSGGSCIYIKRLADVDLTVLAKIITQAYRDGPPK